MNRRIKYGSIFLAALLAAGLLCSQALAASTCVTCHTDEDMLEETVTKVKAVKSAKQAGAG